MPTAPQGVAMAAPAAVDRTLACQHAQTKCHHHFDSEVSNGLGTSEHAVSLLHFVMLKGPQHPPTPQYAALL